MPSMPPRYENASIVAAMAVFCSLNTMAFIGNTSLTSDAAARNTLHKAPLPNEELMLSRFHFSRCADADRACGRHC